MNFGQKVRAINPRNGNWEDSMLGTVIGVSKDGSRIDIHWEHGPYNYGHLAERFAVAED